MSCFSSSLFMTSSSFELIINKSGLSLLFLFASYFFIFNSCGECSRATCKVLFLTSTEPKACAYVRISDFRLYCEITDGKSITYMIAGLNKEYGDVVESGLLFADPSVVERETDELIEKAIAFKHAYRQQYQYYFADKQMFVRSSYEYRCTAMG